MNVLEYSWSRIIGMDIPYPILDLAFPHEARTMPTRIEERMLVKCVRPLVMTDMNILGGTMMYIPMSGCNLVAVNDISLGTNGSFIIDVPKRLLGGTNEDRFITVVYSLVMGEGYGTNYTAFPKCVSPTIADTTKLSAAIGPTNVIQTARLELVGENKILVEGYPTGLMNAVICVNVANNWNLENIQPVYYHAVYELILAGIQSYIYNNLRIQLDTGYLYAGHEIPAIKEIVDSYSDASERYKNLLKKYAKIAVLNDTRKATKWTSLQIGMMA
nr:MAG TPA: Putative virion structural protein [Caudoviricetes sp.]